ncbi:unnamed protein product [Brassica napus]|uniref:(rape) hypothetical protein n=1 Tax=Brassica napus TaxID=3708 RepID=A0A816WFH4_BRANA|nr:unnamed protein product [Brassica napus]
MSGRDTCLLVGEDLNTCLWLLTRGPEIVRIFSFWVLGLFRLLCTALMFVGFMLLCVIWASVLYSLSFGLL